MSSILIKTKFACPCIMYMVTNCDTCCCNPTKIFSDLLEIMTNWLLVILIVLRIKSFILVTQKDSKDLNEKFVRKKTFLKVQYKFWEPNRPKGSWQRI